MGPMMGGWSAGGLGAVWLGPLLVVLVLAAVVLLASRGWPTALPSRRQRTPEELVRERYARGEIGWPEYREVLVNLLKDRYTRGELELAEYEERVARLLEDGVPGRGKARLEPPAAGEERLANR